TEEWVRPRAVRGIAQIEAKKSVVHRRCSGEAHVLLAAQLGDVLRPQAIQKIDVSALKARDRRGKVGRHRPDNAIQSRASPIVGAVCDDCDALSLLPPAKPESSASYR